MNGRGLFDEVEDNNEMMGEMIDANSAVAFAIKVAGESPEYTASEFAMIVACPRAFFVKHIKKRTWYHVLGSMNSKDGISFGSILLFTARGRIICEKHESDKCICCQIGKEDITGVRSDAFDNAEGDEVEEADEEMEDNGNVSLASTTKPRVLPLFSEGYPDISKKDLYDIFRPPKDLIPTVKCTCRQCICTLENDECDCPLFEQEIRDKNCVCRLVCNICDSPWSELTAGMTLCPFLLRLLRTINSFYSY